MASQHLAIAASKKNTSPNWTTAAQIVLVFDLFAHNWE